MFLSLKALVFCIGLRGDVRDLLCFQLILELLFEFTVQPLYLQPGLSVIEMQVAFLVTLLLSGHGVAESPIVLPVSLGPCSPGQFLTGCCGHGELMDFTWAASAGSQQRVGGG